MLGGFLFDIGYQGTEKQEKIFKKTMGKQNSPTDIKHTKGLFYQLYFKDQAESGPKSH